MLDGFRRWCLGPAAAVAICSNASGQDLADYDYENLSFRGLGLEAGVIFPDRLKTATAVHVRFDLGFLGPGFRLSPTVSYWSSDFKTSEVSELEDRLEQLIVNSEPGATPTVDLGSIRWSDVVFGVDVGAQFNKQANQVQVGRRQAPAIRRGNGIVKGGKTVVSSRADVGAGFDRGADVLYPLLGCLFVLAVDRGKQRLIVARHRRRRYSLLKNHPQLRASLVSMCVER